MAVRSGKALLLAACVLAPGYASSGSAQTACPVGTAPGSATCGPAPASGGEIPSPPPRPSGEWIKTWGAIASAPNGDAGVSSGKLSKGDAERTALQNCAGLGNTSCSIALTYRNQCVAAVNPVGGGEGGVISTAATLPEAVARATGKCGRASGGPCKASIAECSPPLFRKY